MILTLRAIIPGSWPDTSRTQNFVDGETDSTLLGILWILIQSATAKQLPDRDKMAPIKVVVVVLPQLPVTTIKVTLCRSGRQNAAKIRP
jgi:hypothetical protein